MAQIGDVIVVSGGKEWRLRPLSVRQLATMQRMLGAVKAAESIEDAKSLGLDPEKALERAAEIRQQAQLTSWIIRWCFELDGAFRIVREAIGSVEAAEEFCSSRSPDELTEVALQLIGFEWDANASKWVSRSARSGGATDSTSASS